MLFCLTDPETVLGTSTGMPITELIYQTTQSRAAAVILSVSLGVCFINGTLGCITTSSRLIYAMARDNGIVFPSVFGRIRKGLDVPVECIILTYIFNLCFGLLYLGPTVAFSAYAASCTIFLNISYAIPVAVVCIRGRQVLESLQSASTPFKLGRTLGTFCNWISVIFVAVTSVFFCFPPGLPATAKNMNYVSVVIGIFLLLLSSYWLVYGKRFQGPVRITSLHENLYSRG
jgi:choline transport protein